MSEKIAFAGNAVMGNFGQGEMLKQMVYALQFFPEAVIFSRFSQGPQIESRNMPFGFSAESIFFELIQNVPGFRSRKDWLTLLLDLDVTTGLARARKKTKTADRMEAQKRSFYEAVRRGFRELARHEPRRIKLIHATESIPEVAEAIWDHVRSLLK